MRMAAARAKPASAQMPSIQDPAPLIRTKAPAWMRATPIRIKQPKTIRKPAKPWSRPREFLWIACPEVWPEAPWWGMRTLHGFPAIRSLPSCSHSMSGNRSSKAASGQQSLKKSSSCEVPAQTANLFTSPLKSFVRESSEMAFPALNATGVSHSASASEAIAQTQTLTTSAAAEPRTD